MTSTEAEPFRITHKEAVRRAARWLSGSKRFSVVISELVTQAGETPDVIAFQNESSILIECKVSRSDFLSDKKKLFRIYESSGMGDLRYFAAPPGIIEPSDLPPGWGLLVIERHVCRERVSPTLKKANKRSEVSLLSSALRRLQISTCVFVRQDVDEPTLEASHE